MESALREGGREPGLTLIETMLWDGQGAPRWALHLARLQRSCRLLGWTCPAVVEPAGPDHPARLRLTLDRDGRMEWTAAEAPAAQAAWRLGLSNERLRSDDAWLLVKSSRREVYDRARAALPEGLDEVILLNERGEVCDGTITTVFFDRGQGMRTPPLGCGVLPGVLRAERDCPEEVLLAGDIPGVRLWVGNAVRGLIPVVWAG